MIKVLKSGNWALEGRDLVELVEGEEQDFGPSNNVALVNAGWASWKKKSEDEKLAEAHADAEDSKDVDVDDSKDVAKNTKKAK